MLDWRFHHIGLALKKEDQALAFLKALGYTAGEKLYDPAQDVNLRLLTAPDKPSIEFVMQGENPDGPLKPFLKGFNEMMYHTCYEVTDREKALADLSSKELRAIQIAPPKPAILFGGRLVSFYQVIGFGIIEFLEP